MHCTNCGNEINENEKFCTNCGNKIEIPPELQQQEQNQTIEEKNNISTESTVVEVSDPANNKVEEKVQTISSNVEEKPKKKVKKTPIIIIISVLAVIAVALLIVKFVMFSPKNLFLKGVNEAYSSISDSFDELYSKGKNDKYKDKIVNIDTNTTFDIDANGSYLDSSMIVLFNLLNQINLDINETIDYKTSNFDMGISLSNNSGNIDVETYTRDNVAYLKLVDIYDKYISVPFEVTVVTTNMISKEDLDYVTKTIKDIFLSSLDDSKFKQESTTLTLQGEELNANKISYEIDSIEASRLVNEITTKMCEDDKLLEILATNFGVTKEELKTSLEQLNSEVDTTSSDKVTLNVYTKGLLNEVVAYDVYVKSEETSFKLSYSDYKDIDEIKVSLNGMTMFTMSINELSENESEIEIKALTATMKINTVSSNDKTTVTITLDELSSAIDFDGKVVYTSNDGKGNVNINAKLNINEENIFDASINSTYEINTDGTLKQIDTNNSVNYKLINETDLQEMMNNLQSNQFLISIMNTLMGY